jgi:hypothetical protein
MNNFLENNIIDFLKLGLYSINDQIKKYTQLIIINILEKIINNYIYLEN